MDFARSEEQQEIAGLARRILEDKVTIEVLRAIDEDESTGRFDRGIWKALAEANLLGVAVPEEQGGLGLGIIEQCIVLEEVGRTVAPVPVLASIVGGALPIAQFGTKDQQDRWVRPAVLGDVVLASALVERLNRRPEQPTTTATQRASDWVLDGVKTCVPAGTIADAILVPASLGDGRIGVFIVEADATGVTVKPQRVTDGDIEAEITLAGVTIGPEAVLGSIEQGPGIVDWMVERSTIAMAAQVSGIVARALEMTAAYTKERIQFDRPIATFQAVAQRAADAYIDVEAVRLVVLQAAWKLSEDGDASIDVEVAKFWAAEAAHRVAHTAVHLHGGTGIDLDHPIHRYFVAAKQLEFSLGGATEQLLRIGAAFAASRE